MKKDNIIILLILALLSITINAQDTDDIFLENHAKVELLVNALIEKAHLPGLSIAVSKNEKVIYAKGFGFADIENNVEMNSKTELRTASIAKVITATAIAKLVSEGKLDLDAPIHKYVPYINLKYAKLTSRQLAGHTSGLEHRPKGNRYKKKQFNTIRETVALMNADLLFSPDSDYKYSTHAFNLLAAVIEGASGKTFEDYLKESIFDPLGMHNTYAENIKTLDEKSAKLYFLKNNKLKRETLTNDSYKIPGAGFRSTPTDLVKMMHAYNNGFISKSVINTIFQSHTLTNGTKTNVGIAWRSSFDIFGNAVIEHAGNWRGARSVIVYYPNENLNISIMVNASCDLIIEETAHIIAQYFITNENKEDYKELNISKSIGLTFNSPDGIKTYEGTLTIDGKIGSLTTNSKGFLKNNKVYYLGDENHYVMVTKYGILYLELDAKQNISGKLFIYPSRQSKPPKDAKPMAVFSSID